jgi:hypothetical protein
MDKNFVDLLHEINADFIHQINDQELKYLIRQIAAECFNRGHLEWLSKQEIEK